MGDGDSIHVNHGIIQGSILGPILYLLYTKDFPDYIADTKVVMYDDNIIQFIHPCPPCDVLVLTLFQAGFEMFGFVRGGTLSSTFNIQICTHRSDKR